MVTIPGSGQLHRVPQHIYQKFVRVPKFPNKHDYLMDAIDNDLAKKHSVMIFSNKGATSNWIYHFLRQKVQLSICLNVTDVDDRMSICLPSLV